MSRRRSEVNVIPIVIAVLILIAVGVIFTVSIIPGVKSELDVEIGSAKPTVSDFLSKPNKAKNVKIISGLEEADMNQLGSYPVRLKVLFFNKKTTLRVVDTTAPEVTLIPLGTQIDTLLKAEEFVESINDATATVVTYETEPDFSKDGEFEVTICVTDAAGNTTKATTQLTIYLDTEAPVIEGVQELTIAAGGSVSYKKNITITDNMDPEPTLTVDNSAVDLKTPGDYPVVYVATDEAGNETRIETVLHVKKPSAETATEDMVNEKAREILASITTDGMTQYEVAQAIYNWCHENIAYVDGTPKNTWIEGAYRGLFNRQGDCYTYASTAKCLLTQAGITNMDIEKIPAKSHHYWNLIDLGDGWYHFDTTRRKDGTTFFYWSDEKLMDYSNSHSGSHNYDKTMYPEIQ